jgi:hypothetical protein
LALVARLITPAFLILAGCATAPAAGADPSRLGLEPGSDTCNARSIAFLLGRSVSEAPRHLQGRGHRIAGLRAPITADYGPGRINIFFDERTQRIVGIRCG